MFSFLVDGKAKNAKSVFYAKGETEVVEDALSEQHQLRSEQDSVEELERNEKLISLMKNNDGKWMDTLAEQLNSSSDGEEEEEDYSEEEEDMYGIEQLNDEQPSEGNYAQVDAPTKKHSKIDAKNVETGEQPRPTPTHNTL